MPEIINFAEFGPLFAKELFSRELIEIRVKAAVPRRLPFDADWQAYGEARAVSVRAESPVAEACLVTCKVHVSMDLDLTFLRINPLALRFKFPLEITFRPYPGLLIATEVEPLKGTDVEIESRVDRSWMQMVGDFLKEALLAGLPAVVSDCLSNADQFKGAIADKINQNLQASADDMVIDVEAMLHEGLAIPPQPPGPKPPFGVPVNLGPGVAIPRGEKVFREMKTGSNCHGDLLLRKGEGIRIHVYGQIDYAPPLMFSHGGNLSFGIGKDLDGSLNIRDQAWGEDKNVGEFPPPGVKSFRAPHAGRYPFTIHCGHAESLLRIWIVQVRQGISDKTLRDLKPVCFDRFAEELMTQGLSAEVIEGMVQNAMAGGKLSTTIPLPSTPWGPMDLDVNLALKSVTHVATTAPGVSQGRMFTFTVKVKGMYSPQPGGKRNHRLFALPDPKENDGITLTVVVHLRTAKHPISIVPMPADLDDWRLDIQWSKLVVQEEALQERIQKWLESDTVKRVEEWLRSQWKAAALPLESQLGVLSGMLAQTISKVSEDAVRATPGPVDAPWPVAGQHEFSNIGSSVLPPGQASYHEVQLKKDQKIRVVAEIRSEDDTESLRVSLNVLDAFKGILTENDILAFEAGSMAKQTRRFLFKAPADGKYYVGIRVWPRYSDDAALTGVRFRITVSPV